MARTRIPTPHGEVFLHLYHNSVDAKEHLAIVFDPIQLDESVRARAPKGRKEIRSRSLDEKWRDGETDLERVVRGAYVGRLGPGGETQASSAPSKSTSELSTAASDMMDDMEGLHIIGPNGDEGGSEESDILPLVRIHSECFTGETVGSMRCDCGEQLDEAIRLISTPQPLPVASDFSSTPMMDTPPLRTQTSTPKVSRSPSPSTTLGSSSQSLVPGRGVVIYLRQEGRGIGLLEKIRAYNLQDLGHDTVTANLMLGHRADERSYTVAAAILRDLGLGGSSEDHPSRNDGIRLLTNNPDKVGGLAAEGVKIVQRVGMVPRDWQCPVNSLRRGLKSLEVEAEQGEEESGTWEKEYEDWRLRRAGVGMIGAGKAQGKELEKYLRTKVEKMGHCQCGSITDIFSPLTFSPVIEIPSDTSRLAS